MGDWSSLFIPWDGYGIRPLEITHPGVWDIIVGFVWVLIPQDGMLDAEVRFRLLGGANKKLRVDWQRSKSLYETWRLAGS